MKNTEHSYNKLAQYYDAFQNEAELEQTVQAIIGLCDLHLRPDGKSEILRLTDLGCGTGSLAIRLAEYDFQITAVDISVAMLQELEKKRQKLPKNQRERISIVKDDITLYRLMEQQAVLISMTDSLNHLPPEAMMELFETAAQNLRRGGLFLFDLLHLQFLAKNRGNQTFFSELGLNTTQADLSMVWKNKWQPSTATAVSKFTFFERIEGTDHYQRSTDEIVEYYHDVKTITYLWDGVFELVSTKDTAERRFFVLKRM